MCHHFNLEALRTICFNYNSLVSPNSESRWTTDGQMNKREWGGQVEVGQYYVYYGRGQHISLKICDQLTIGSTTICTLTWLLMGFNGCNKIQNIFDAFLSISVNYSKIIIPLSTKLYIPTNTVSLFYGRCYGLLKLTALGRRMSFKLLNSLK